MAHGAVQDPAPSGRKDATGCQLQSRIRRVLISALQNLDLQDKNTLKCLESSLIFIQGLLDQVDLDAFPSTSSARHWRQLRWLISGADDVKVEQSEETSGSRQKRLRLSHADSSGVSNGAYHPNKKVKGKVINHWPNTKQIHPSIVGVQSVDFQELIWE